MPDADEKGFYIPTDAIADTRALQAEREQALSAQVARVPTTEPLLQFFTFAHLPPHLAAISECFGRLAYEMVDKVPRNPERTVALRKLLEAKDCAVRALLYK